MTETEKKIGEIDIAINDHCHRIGSLEHRMSEQENQSKTITDLVIEVKEISMSMKQMLTEQIKQGERLDSLEQEPAQNWKAVKSGAISAVVAGIIGAVVTYLVAVM